ncbi:hypothetical protein CRUP_017250, partial [Coryphaenoides rupestris]
MPPPRSLTFSEVGSRSFRASWETDTPSVRSYLVRFRPIDNTDGHFVSLSLPGDTLTSVLPHLTPKTRYEVNVVAQYDKGESFPRGDNARLETTVPAGDTAAVLHRLLPRTKYRVTATPEYESGDGPETQTYGTTKEARGSPRNLRVSDETVSTLRVSWAPAPGNVLQYRLAFRPVGSSDRKDRKEVSVKGENTAAVLKNLRPGTEYEVSVRARYRPGLGDALDGRGTTLEGPEDRRTCAARRPVVCLLRSLCSPEPPDGHRIRKL